MKKRILWVLNHDTLSKFELPLIKDLGFEVFTPKIVPKSILQQSGSVTYAFDNTLTIPKQDLKTLNEYNFYENEDMPFTIRNLINKYFDITIVMFDFYALRKIIDNFDGYIFARAFGLGEELTYYDITSQVCGEDFFYKIEQIKDRFWFSHCYENIAEIEKGIYKEKAIYMPLGLPNDFYTEANLWTGVNDKLLFFCTRINHNDIAKSIYKKFKKDFDGFDYSIAGNQPVPVSDERVLGFMEREELNNVFKESKVMYYHSTFPRHLHYHPLEAIIIGLPVIYMDGGALSVLGGSRQAGRCKDITEARRKVQQILDGDKQFIQDVIEDQKEIIYKFSYEYNKEVWERNFLSIINKLTFKKSIQSKEIAVFISNEQLKHHINDYIETINNFGKGINEINLNNKVVLNIPCTKFNDNDYNISHLLQSNISVREYTFEELPTNNTVESLALMFKQEVLWYENYIFPVDYAHNYIDSDYWLFMQGDISQPIAPLKPYGIYVENLNERYYKTLSTIIISNYKNANFLLTSSEITKNDLIKHLGINEQKILMLPMTFSENKLSSSLVPRKKYNLIEVDLCKYNNITSLLSTISDYFSLYEINEQIKIHINNYSLSKDENLINQLKDFVNKSNLNEFIIFYYDLTLIEYDSLYAHAEKIIIPHSLNNVFNKLIKAAYYMKKIYLEDLPYYKEIERKINYNFVYKNFKTNCNAVLEVLSDSSGYSTSNVEKPTCILDDISQPWRQLL